MESKFGFAQENAKEAMKWVEILESLNGHQINNSHPRNNSIKNNFKFFQLLL